MDFYFRLTDEWKNYRRLSRRQILFQQQQESGPGSSSSSSVQVTLCSQCCHPTEMDSGSTMDQTTTTTTTVSHIPARRRNSTYLALACANAVSQGAMTRSLRQMFETQPVRETQPLLSRAEIKQQIQAARLRRNSIAVLYPSGASGSPEQQPDDIVTAIPAVVVDAVPIKQQPPPTPAKPTTTTTAVSSPPSTPLQFKLPASPVTDNAPVDMSSPLCIRCDKCSSILTSPPVAVSLVINSGKSFSSAVTQPPTSIHQEIMAKEEKEVAEERTPSPSKIIPTNREVLEEELPKPDTVKNARCLFESSFMEASSSSSGNFSTLQHVKSNPSSKILRSESSMTLDRAGTRSSSVTSRPSPFRWPSRQEHARNRSPSPSPSPSPIPALVIPAATKSHHHKITSSTLPSYYRSSPSLTQYRSSRHSLHSTDVESYVSEGGSDCWSSSDLESEASYSSVSGGGGGGRDDLSDSLDGMRYISPDVMEKIRSYGMTLTFVNGKMVDEDDDDQEEPEVMAKEAATRKVVQSIRSAGQSQPITATFTPAPVAPTKSAIKQQTKEKLLKSASPPPRIVACLPKQETVEKANNNNNNQQQLQFTQKIRHSSGESSASSGVSSGTNAGSDSSSSSSEHNSPFASLKRTKSAGADHTVERSPSPGPRQSGTRKAVGSSPFGCYSVVYSFNASARSPMYV
jgi:hypothetical protein